MWKCSTVWQTSPSVCTARLWSGRWRKTIWPCFPDKCLEITPNSVKIENADGVQELEADTVLYALGMKTVDYSALKEAAGDAQVYVIGDAIHPGKVDQCTRTGYIAALKIGASEESIKLSRSKTWFPGRYAASHKEVKRNLARTGVLNHAGSDSFRDSLPIFKGMRICPT